MNHRIVHVAGYVVQVDQREEIVLFCVDNLVQNKQEENSSGGSFAISLRNVENSIVTVTDGSYLRGVNIGCCQ